MNHRKLKDELVCVHKFSRDMFNESLYSFKIGNFTREKRQLDEKLSRKESELEIIRHELNQVKEFRKKKTQMQKELEEVILNISYELFF